MFNNNLTQTNNYSPLQLPCDLYPISGFTVDFALPLVASYLFYDEHGMPDFFGQSYQEGHELVQIAVKAYGFGSGLFGSHLPVKIEKSQPFHAELLKQLPAAPIILVNSLEVAQRNQIYGNEVDCVIWLSWYGDFDKVDWKRVAGREVYYLHLPKQHETKKSQLDQVSTINKALSGIAKEVKFVNREGA